MPLETRSLSRTGAPRPSSALDVAAGEDEREGRGNMSQELGPKPRTLDSEDTVRWAPRPPTRPPPPVPRRQASLRKASCSSSDAQPRREHASTPRFDPDADDACGQVRAVQGAEAAPSAALPSATPLTFFCTQAETRGQWESRRTYRGKGLMVPDTPFAVRRPMAVDVRGGDESQIRARGLEKTLVHVGRSVQRCDGRVQEKKEKQRDRGWSWANWWQ